MIEAVLIAALVGTWFWTVLNDDEGIFAPANALLQKNRYSNKFLRCPWCSGAWFSIVPAVILLWGEPLDIVVLSAFAAAAITGILGSTILGE